MMSIFTKLLPFFLCIISLHSYAQDNFNLQEKNTNKETTEKAPEIPIKSSFKLSDNITLNVSQSSSTQSLQNVGTTANASSVSYTGPEEGVLAAAQVNVDIDKINVELIPGENVNFQNNSFYWEVRDVYMPTNSELNIEIYRSYNKSPNTKILALESWALEVPRIEFSSSSYGKTNGELLGVGLCTDVKPFDYKYGTNHGWGGSKNDFSFFSLIIPNEAPKQLLFKASDATQFPSEARYVTIDNWYVRCVTSSDPNGAGDTFEAVSPEGIIYTFDEIGRKPVKENVLASGVISAFVTKIKDRHGNWLKYSYKRQTKAPSLWRKVPTREGFMPFVRPYLSQITSSDSQVLTLEYTDLGYKNRLKMIKANDKVWKYNYDTSSVTDLRPTPSVAPHLESVEYPDGTRNSYEYIIDYSEQPGQMDYYGTSGDSNSVMSETDPHGTYGLLKKATLMSGLTIEYKYEICEPLMITLPNGYSGYVPCIPTIQGKVFSGSGSPLVKRTVSGPGLTPVVWNISQSPSFKEKLNIYNLRDLKVQKIIYKMPNKTIVYHSHMTNKAANDDWMHGVLIKKEVFSANANINTGTPLLVESYEYIEGSQLGVSGVYLERRDLQEHVKSRAESSWTQKLMTSKTIAINGNKYTTKYANHNQYGVAQLVTETNSFSSDKRYTKYEYTHDLTNYVLNMPTKRSVSTTGSDYTIVSSKTYHTATGTYKSLPYEEQSFGVWQKRYSKYYSDGNVKKVEFNTPLSVGSGMRYQEFSNYRRGIAQTITLPGRYSTEPIRKRQKVDDNGWIEQSKDFEGNIINYGYDALGRVKYIDPVDVGVADALFSWAYNGGVGADQPVLVVTRCTLNTDKKACADAAKFRSTITYDGLLRPVLTRATDVANSNTVYQNKRFNAFGELKFQSFLSNSATERSGTSFKYDGLQRLTSQSVSNGGTTHQDYLSGNIIKVTDANDNETTTTYLAYGEPSFSRATFIDSPEGVDTRISIDIFGNTNSIRQSGDQRSGAISLTEYRAYDKQKRLCQIKRNDVGTTIFSHNTIGEITWRAQGQKPDSNTTCLTKATTSQKVNFTYDNIGQQRTISYGDGTRNLTYTRDKNGDVTQLISGDIKQTYQYTSRRQLDWESLVLDGKLFKLDYSYDALGALVSVTYPNTHAKSSIGTVTFAPNGFGQATQAVNASDQYAKGATYYPNAVLNTFKYGNGLTHKTTLNSRKLPSIIRDHKQGSDRINLAYTYDYQYNVKSIIDKVNTNFSLTSLSYDSLNRLTSTQGNSGIGNSSITYDELGNITHYSTLNGGKNHDLTYTYDTSKNKLTGVTGTGAVGYDFNQSNSYDSRGNVTHNGIRSFTYNLANHMTASKKGSDTNNYIYDGYNRRVKTTDSKGTSYSMYSQSGRLMYRETPEGGISYIFLGNKLIAKEGVMPVSVSSRMHYKPFGDSIEEAKDEVGFTGHKFDTDLGLSYMQARYYDPVIGRFYSNDPVGYTAANPVMSFNRYLYVNNNPYKYVDPDGKLLFTAIAIAAVAYAAYDGYQDGGATGALAEASGYNDAVSSYNSIKSGDYSGAAISAAGILCKACKGATRVRHYTSKSGMGGIQDSGVIKASDQNSVFTVKAKGKPGSPRDVEKQLGIKKGKGNAYVEFDASPDEFTTIKNAKTGATERVFNGDVNLEGRNATFKKNR